MICEVIDADKGGIAITRMLRPYGVCNAVTLNLKYSAPMLCP